MKLSYEENLVVLLSFFLVKLSYEENLVVFVKLTQDKIPYRIVSDT